MERQKRAQRFVKPPPPKWHQTFDNTTCLMLRFSKSNWYVLYIEWLILSNHFRDAGEKWSVFDMSLRWQHTIAYTLHSNLFAFHSFNRLCRVFFSAFHFLSHSFRLKSRGAVMVMVIRFCVTNVKYRRARTVHENNHKSYAIDVAKMKSAKESIHCNNGIR